MLQIPPYYSTAPMNIFILDKDPAIAARMLCDKHIVKMTLESAQMLCILARYYHTGKECDEAGLYKSTHEKHPCQLWLREHPDNWAWLWHHICALNSSWRLRFKHDEDHKSFDVATHAACLLQKHFDMMWVKPHSPTPFVQCMPDIYKVPGDAVTAYRRYYVGEKLKFAKWTNASEPEWIDDPAYKLTKPSSAK